jgi:hypothetical protein
MIPTALEEDPGWLADEDLLHRSFSALFKLIGRPEYARAEELIFRFRDKRFPLKHAEDYPGFSEDDATVEWLRAEVELICGIAAPESGEHESISDRPKFDPALIPDPGPSRHSDDDIDTLLDGVGIVDAYSRWCGKMVPDVRGRSEGIMISCPVPGHTDANPSAWMNSDKQLWFCAVCDQGGDKFDLAGFHHGIDARSNPSLFPELRRKMAEDLGLVAPWIDRFAPATTGAPAGHGMAKSASASTTLVEIAQEAYVLGQTDAGEPFAVARGGPNIAHMLRGGRNPLRAELARVFFERFNKAASQAALADAMNALEGFAFLTPPKTLPLRIAEYGDGVVLDLGTPDGKACVVTPDGWEVVSTSPVTFRRTELTGALPTPTAGGRLDELRSLVNFDTETWDLVVGFLVAAVIPWIPHPIAFMRGEQGSGKTTAARILTTLLDASPAPVRSAPRHLEEWAVGAAASWIVLIDNVSSVTEWFSDALCRAVTGDGVVRRRLYTDSGLSVLSLRRVVILTSIDAGALRGDLADRLLPIDLRRLGPSERKLDREIDRLFAECHPRVLGALMTLVSKVLKVLPTIPPAALPRMADAAHVFEAVDTVAGTKARDKYLRLGTRMAEEVVEGDPVADAVRRLAISKGTWSGTATQLLLEITPASPAPVPKSWPPDPARLMQRLNRAQAALRDAGVNVTTTRVSKAGTRMIKLDYAPTS